MKKYEGVVDGTRLHALHARSYDWEGVTLSKKCVLVLDSLLYAALYLEQTRTPVPGAQNQKPYSQRSYYVLGEVPLVYSNAEKRPRNAARRRHNGVCWNDSSDATKTDWYIAGYMQDLSKLTDEQRNTYHPEGQNFLLHPWQVPSGEAIDHYHKLSGKIGFLRLPMHVVEST